MQSAPAYAKLPDLLARLGHISPFCAPCAPADHFPGPVTGHKWSCRAQGAPACTKSPGLTPPSQVTSVTPVGFVDVATTFQGAETIKCGHGVYKVGWSLQSHATLRWRRSRRRRRSSGR